MSDLIEMILPLSFNRGGPGGSGPEDGERQRQTVIRAATEAFGSAAPITSRTINVGRGGDAGGLLVQIAELAGLGIGILLGPAELVRRGRDAIDEYRGWARSARSFVRQLRESEDPPLVLSANLATMVAIAELEERAGPVTQLVWWNEILVQPFEWVPDERRFDRTAERVYSYVFETERSRWYIVTKGDGSLVSEIETMIPGDYVEYQFWRRHEDVSGGDGDDATPEAPGTAVRRGRAPPPGASDTRYSRP
jgi:hypothetical protein